MFDKVLVANRGEIALRIFRACRELGLRSVAVTSDVDRDAPWARLADESYPLAGVKARETYLNQEAIFAAVEASGAGAVHPGYGFLSENADFAQACLDRGIQFVGPTPAAMRALGSKVSARDLAREAGVPVIPGVDGAEHSDGELAQAAERIGYPVLIKASAGGGGKGMRIVDGPQAFGDALQQARSEAASSFGNDRVLVEKYFRQVRHVEVQILGDHEGHVIHLFDRECSVQRRHQKIIEESPSPALTAEGRREICRAARSLAQAAGYVNAGTVEFVLTPEGDFYFLEMNTRLQVEHPITEIVTGVDIAAWQLRIAGGERLTLQQDQLSQRGHAVECRLYAEDPAHNFMPSIGDISFYRPPAGPGVRVDDGIESGSRVSPYYDPMLGKVITWGGDREEALRKMVRALQGTVILGVTTNVPYLLDILQHEVFMAGEVTTRFLDEHMMPWHRETDTSESTWLAIAALEALQGQGAGRPLVTSKGETGDAETMDPWRSSRRWRNVSPAEAD